MKLKGIQPPDKSPPHRPFFGEQKRPNRPEGNVHGIDEFARDFGSALDRFRVSSFVFIYWNLILVLKYTMLIPCDANPQETALPMYEVTPIEVALHPLGIISHSSCGLESFLYGILDYQRVMEYRIGVVRAIEHYYKRRDTSQDYLLVQFVNERGVENWLQLEMRKPLSECSNIPHLIAQEGY